MRRTKSNIHKNIQNYNFFFIFSSAFSRLQTGRQFWTEFHLHLISLRKQFWFISVVPKYLRCVTFSKGFISSLHVVILSCILFIHTRFPHYSLFDQNPYQHLPNLLYFSSQHLSVTVSVFLPITLTSLAYTRIWCGPFNFSPFRFTCIFLAAYSTPMDIKHHPVSLNSEYN